MQNRNVTIQMCTKIIQKHNLRYPLNPNQQLHGLEEQNKT